MKKTLALITAFAIVRAITRTIKARRVRSTVAAPVATSRLARLIESAATAPVVHLVADADWEARSMARATRNDLALSA